MQGGKNWFLTKEMNANRFFWDSHWLEIWSNHFYPSMGPNGGSVAMDSQQRTAEAQFLVPDWGTDKAGYGVGLPYRLPTCVAWRAGTTRRHSRLLSHTHAHGPSQVLRIRLQTAKINNLQYIVKYSILYIRTHSAKLGKANE